MSWILLLGAVYIALKLDACRRAEKAWRIALEEKIKNIDKDISDYHAAEIDFLLERAEKTINERNENERKD